MFLGKRVQVKKITFREKFQITLTASLTAHLYGNLRFKLGSQKKYFSGKNFFL